MGLAIRVSPSGKPRLSSIDPASTGPFRGKEDPKVEQRLAEATATMVDLQQRLFGEAKRGLLVVLQAMDTGGKDGAIRRVIGPLDSRCCRVESFKAPAGDERAHDYLWRVHQRVPKRGEIVVFNRSHYEDILVPRVIGGAPKHVWERRYRHVVEWERMLAEEGTVVVKVFLHISKDEQKKRLEERLRDPHKRWKFDQADLAMRAKWDDFQDAYGDVLAETSTKHAPWWVVPADKKWFRDVAVAELVAETLVEMAPTYPKPALDLSKVKVP